MNCERCESNNVHPRKTPVGYAMYCGGCCYTKVMPIGWRPSKRRAERAAPRIIHIEPASASPNWDGTTWYVQWSDYETAQIKTSAQVRDHGLRFCKSEARVAREQRVSK
jgi:hypothetical protein